MRKLLASILLLSAVLKCDAANDYSLQIGSVIWVGSPGGYNCFSSTAYPNTVNFTITKKKVGTRDYAVTAGDSSTTGNYNRQLASGGNRLNYQLYIAGAMTFVLEAPPSANANQVISGTSSAEVNTIIPLTFTFFIPPSQLVPPGIYTDQVVVGIYNAYNDIAAAQATAIITITATVAATAAISVVPSGAAFGNSSLTLNFGALASDQVKACDILIKKNNACNVTYSSQNFGVLKLSPPTTDQIPYTMTVSGNTLDLTQPAIVFLPAAFSAAPDGDRSPVAFTIGTVGFPSAGNYQDQLTITLTVQ